MGITEIFVVLIVALIVLGPERLPEVLRSAGKLMRELQLASHTVMRELTEPLDEQPPARRAEPRKLDSMQVRKDSDPPSTGNT